MLENGKDIIVENLVVISNVKTLTFKTVGSFKKSFNKSIKMKWNSLQKSLDTKKISSLSLVVPASVGSNNISAIPIRTSTWTFTLMQ